MEAKLVVSSHISGQFRLFLRNLTDEQVANILYIVAEWSEEFIQHCYEHEGAAVERFAEMLQEEEA